MKKFSKRKKAWLEKIKEEQKYGLDDAIVLLKEFSKLKFNSTVDVIFLLGIDPSKGEQSVKGSCVLPHGTGKTVKVLVFAKGEKEKEARESGADCRWWCFCNKSKTFIFINCNNHRDNSALIFLGSRIESLAEFHNIYSFLP